MNKGIHLDLDAWIVPGQILTANLRRGLGNSCKPACTEVSLLATRTPQRLKGRELYRDALQPMFTIAHLVNEVGWWLIVLPELGFRIMHGQLLLLLLHLCNAAPV